MFSALQALILSASIFGNILFLITLWSRSSAPLGTKVCRLTSLLCIQLVCLRCSHLPWLLVWARFVTCTKHGRLETSPEPLYGTSPIQSLAILISLRRLRIPWLRLRGRGWLLSGRSPWFLFRRPFRMCLLACRLTLFPRLLLSGYGTRDQGLQQV